jgi:hypothetical protein
MPEYPVEASAYRGPYDHDFDHAACLSQQQRDAADPFKSIEALHKLAQDVLNPEVYGFSVTSEVRDAARAALGLKPCETSELVRAEMKWYTQEEIAEIIVKAQEAARAEVLALMASQVQYKHVGWLRRYPDQHTVFVDVRSALPSDIEAFVRVPAPAGV